MAEDKVIVHGARTHNLRNIHVEIPRNQFVVITGPSGSGKSSLAFDTIYAEGQRRYVESLSAYARQFLEMMDKPDVDYITGLSPAISIEQKTPSHNPRSTIATQTEIYDYLRLLFARVGTPHCPECGKEVRPVSASEIIKMIHEDLDGQDVTILAPVVRGRTGTYEALLKKFKAAGWVRLRVDGKVVTLNGKLPAMSRYAKHTIEIEVDRLKVIPASKERLADSVETALREGRGLVQIEAKGVSKLLSDKLSCPDCGISLPDLEPRLFSFNSPYGACPECEGLGDVSEMDPDLIVPDPDKTIKEGAVLAWSDPITTRTNRWKNSWRDYYQEILESVCRSKAISRDIPWNKLPKEDRNIILYGGGEYKVHWMNKPKEFQGVIGILKRRYQETESDFVKEEIYGRYMRQLRCKSCKGKRLKPEALAVRVGGMDISELTTKSVIKAQEFFKVLEFSDKQKIIARQILKEINSRLGFLANVGLGYLTLDRASQGLSGGEGQRIHLATQIGSGLVGVLYVLDEPTVGLHPRDDKMVIDVLKSLRDQGNTLVVVEHDEEMIRSADWVVDMGPGGGHLGGQVVYSGQQAGLIKADTLTADYLRGDKQVGGEIKSKTQGVKIQADKFLTIKGAKQFNLKNVTVKIPLGKFVCVSGVSGSGKSTLVYEILYKAAAKHFYGAKETPGKHEDIEGWQHLDKVLMVDQDPIGRTPRSNPATYTGVWGEIRDLFSELPESRRRGYKPGRFSFNVSGGRCEKCSGDGMLKIEMQFLADVYVTCEVCNGARFNQETLEVKYPAPGGKSVSIADVLNASVSEARNIFIDFPKIERVLSTLEDVGLGYIKLGQSATTLSGGEAQRVKLSSELSRTATGRTLYILDEPTTGLHFDDVAKLLRVLRRLVSAGNTVVVIEHNKDVMRYSDWLIDLGPEGGDGGGKLIAEGAPAVVKQSKESHTAKFL